SWLEEAVDRVAVLARGHHVRIERQARDVHAAVDQLRLARGISNLLSNAAKYGEPGMDIVVTVPRPESMLEIAVPTRGRGLSPAELPKIFDRFVRGESTRGGRVEGLGLGLYISRGIVEAHGGRMWAESTAGDTTSFHLTIPVIVTASSDGSVPTV